MTNGFLPKYFDGVPLTAIDKYKIEYYFEQFVVRQGNIYRYGHVALACYAALPAVLTPDLVHKLWLNFKDYTLDGEPVMIHPVAPVDLLLSSLVEEIGAELYEMPEAVRKALLGYLNEWPQLPGANNLKFRALEEVAAFLHDYAQFDFTPGVSDDDAFREAQVWTALSYLDPQRAFGQVAKGFHLAKTNAERSRYKQAIEKMSGRFSMEIVKDRESIPQGFKAVAKLTSVMRDVLMKRAPAELEAFKKEMAGSDGSLLTETPLVANNVINLEIPAEVREQIAGVGGSSKGKLKALIMDVIGIGAITDDAMPISQNAKRMYGAMREKYERREDVEIKYLRGEASAKAAIVGDLRSMIETAGKKDNLLLYISCECQRREDHAVISINRSDFLRDDEIAAIANEADVASFTIIIDGSNSGSSHWLDTSRTGNVVLSSCKLGQTHYRLPQDVGSREEFTEALVNVLQSADREMTCRDLFSALLSRYEPFAVAQGETVHYYSVISPQLQCNFSSLENIFLNGQNSTASLQLVLRRLGIYSEMVSGKWGEDIATALEIYTNDKKLPVTLPKQGYINHGLQELMTNNHPPVLLFIFCDKRNRLLKIDEEKKQIQDLIDSSGIDKICMVHFLDDPSAADLIELFRRPELRNRIQLVYYSGLDNVGDLELGDGAYGLTDFSVLLNFQENIHLFISNTCRSRHFAEYLVQMGVTMAVGAEGEVDDDYAARIGLNILRTVLETGALEAMPELQPVPDAGADVVRLNKYRLFKAWQVDKDVPVWVGGGARQQAAKTIDGRRKVKMFISYSLNDMEAIDIFLAGLRDHLRTLPGIDIEIVTQNDLTIGFNYKDAIDGLIKNAAIVMVCMSEQYLKDNEPEIHLLSKEIQAGEKLIFPVYFNHVRNSDTNPLDNVNFYKPSGGKYGIDDDDFAFCDLLPGKRIGHAEYTINETLDKYFENLVSALAKTINSFPDNNKLPAPQYLNKETIPPFENEILVERPEVLETIDKELYATSVPFVLSGIGGNGKTSIAISYALHKDYSAKYDHIAWVNASNDIFFDLYTTLQSDTKYEKSTTVDELKALFNKFSGNNLLIIDGQNDFRILNDVLGMLRAVKPSWKCLITTFHFKNLREDNTFRIMNVNSFGRSQGGILFQRYFTKPHNSIDLDDIYEYCDGHVLMIELLAKFGNESKEIVDGYRLVRHMKSILFNKIHEGIFKKYVDAYRLPALQEVEKNVLQALCLLPSVYHSSAYLSQLFTGEKNEAIDFSQLVIRFNNASLLEKKEDSYRLHPFLREICLAWFLPDTSNCRHFIQYFIDQLKGPYIKIDAEFTTQSRSISDNLEKVMGEIPDPLLAQLQHYIGKRLIDERELYTATQWLHKADLHFGRFAELYDLEIENNRLKIHAYTRLSTMDKEGVGYNLSLVSAHQSLARTYERGNRYEEAMSHFAKALEIALQTFERDSSQLQNRNTLADAYKQIGYLHRRTNNNEEALRNYGIALVYMEETATQFPDDEHNKSMLAYLYQDIAWINIDTKKEVEALGFSAKGMQVSQELYEQNPGNVYNRRQLIYAYETHSQVNARANRPEEAMVPLNDARALIMQSIEQFPDDTYYQFMLAGNYEILARLEHQLYGPAQAKESLTKANEITLKLVEAEPDNRNYLVRLAISHQNLGTAFEQTNEIGLARDQYIEFNRLSKQVAEDNPHDNGDQEMLASSYLKLGQLIRGGEHNMAIEEAKRIYTRLAEANPNDLHYAEMLDYIASLQKPPAS